MDNLIYLVIGACGKYDDHSEWVAGYTLEESKAQQIANQLQEHAKRVYLECAYGASLDVYDYLEATDATIINRLEECLKEMRDIDPHFSSDGLIYQAYYKVQSVTRL